MLLVSCRAKPKNLDFAEWIHGKKKIHTGVDSIGDLSGTNEFSYLWIIWHLRSFCMNTKGHLTFEKVKILLI